MAAGGDATGIRPGRVIEGRFEIRTLIGAGGFGRVYHAVDRAAGRDVAVKTLCADVRGRPEPLQRFAREAEVCEQLAHPNTARLLHVGDTGDDPCGLYLVFELVRGLSLERIFVDRPHLTLEEVVHVCVGVLGSLGEAHQLGIVHRDIKPANVMLAAPEATWRAPSDAATLAGRVGVPPTSDPVWWDLAALTVKLCDFGLAKPLPIGGREVAALTAADGVPGTTSYLSPEQTLRRPDIDHRSDLYGVAMLLFRMLAGAPPYAGRTPPDTAWAHVTDPIPELPPPWCDQPIAAVFQRAAAKKPRARHGSAAEMAWALACTVDPELEARGRPEFPRPPRVRSRRRLLGWIGGRRGEVTPPPGGPRGSRRGRP